jgi:hypothetical protein
MRKKTTPFCQVDHLYMLLPVMLGISLDEKATFVCNFLTKISLNLYVRCDSTSGTRFHVLHYAYGLLLPDDTIAGLEFVSLVIEDCQTEIPQTSRNQSAQNQQKKDP